MLVNLSPMYNYSFFSWTFSTSLRNAKTIPMVTLLEWIHIHILVKFCQEDICLFEWVWHVQGLFPAKQRIDKPRELSCIICLVLYLKECLILISWGRYTAFRMTRGTKLTVYKYVHAYRGIMWRHLIFSEYIIRWWQKSRWLESSRGSIISSSLQMGEN